MQSRDPLVIFPDNYPSSLLYAHEVTDYIFDISVSKHRYTYIHISIYLARLYCQMSKRRGEYSLLAKALFKKLAAQR